MAHEHADLHDPDTDPLATYVFEPDDVRPLLARVVASPGHPTAASIAPFTGAPIAAVPLTRPQDLPEAARRARAAQKPWATLPPAARAALLLRVHDLLLERQSDVLDLLQVETGKARTHAWEEVGEVANAARYYGLRAPRLLAPRAVRGLWGPFSRGRVLRHPVGVVAVLTPWNYPLSLGLGDALPALAAGNAVLLRADPQTALTLLWCAELLEDAGLPTDLVQVVVGGPDVGMERLEHVDHCIDVIRQVLMCHGDLSLHTYDWIDDYRWPWANFTVQHQCRDWDSIMDWASNNHIKNLRGPIVTHPIHGKFGLLRSFVAVFFR